MAVRCAINGFGRIGRLVLRAGLDNPDFEFVAVNDITDAGTLAYLVKHDSVHGIWDKEVAATDSAIKAGGKEIKVFSEKDPSKLPWKGKSDDVLTIVMGVNDGLYDSAKHRMVSTASCTTNCLAPVCKVLNDSFGIVKGQMTTVHAYTNDQRILDLPHSDLRRARAACVSIIPTSTGAAKAIGLVIPELDGKLSAIALRVPTADGSVVDLNVEVEKSVSAEGVNAAFKKAGETAPLKPYLRYSEDPLVSIDIVGNPHSAIFDAPMTSVSGGNLIKVLAWYDNEWGYSRRMIDMMSLIAKT
jgi:glyceraldehyde 3-phosphate dehydrogenase